MGARLKFWRRGRVPKKGSRDEAVEIFLAASPLETAPPSNLTRLYYNGSAVKSHSTTTQYRQLRRLETKEIPLLAASPIAGNLVLTDLQPWQITHSLISIILQIILSFIQLIIIANCGD